MATIAFTQDLCEAQHLSRARIEVYEEKVDFLLALQKEPEWAIIDLDHRVVTWEFLHDCCFLYRRTSFVAVGSEQGCNRTRKLYQMGFSGIWTKPSSRHFGYQNVG